MTSERSEPASRAPVLASVIVRSYNYRRFLGAAIESALAQTYAPLQVVVVDDGSTDGSQGLIESYGGRIRSILKENGGMASSLEAGLAGSDGEIVVYLDADDVLLPDAVMSAAAELNDPRAVKVHWPMVEIDETGLETGRILPRIPLAAGDLRQTMIAEGPMSGDGPPTSGNAWRRGFLENALPMPEPRRGFHADSYLHTLAALRGRVAKVDRPLTLYRSHGSNEYSAVPLSDRLGRDLTMYHYRCRLQSAELRASGDRADPCTWKINNAYYEQLERRFKVVQLLDALIPQGQSFILVDEGVSGTKPIHGNRAAMRFPTTPDNPRGLPADDDTAIAELARMREEGALFIAFIKPALWWLRKYEGLRRHLEDHFSRDFESEHLIAFSLVETRAGTA